MLVWNDLEADEKIKVYDKGVADHQRRGRLRPAGQLPLRRRVGAEVRSDRSAEGRARLLRRLHPERSDADQRRRRRPARRPPARGGRAVAEGPRPSHRRSSRFSQRPHGRRPLRPSWYVTLPRSPLSDPKNARCSPLSDPFQARNQAACGRFLDRTRFDPGRSPSWARPTLPRDPRFRSISGRPPSFPCSVRSRTSTCSPIAPGTPRPPMALGTSGSGKRFATVGHGAVR